MFVFLQGVLYPALHNLISKWSAPDERGKFISALLGGTFGTVATWPLAGLLMESFGWAYAFYVPAAIAIFITCIWLLVVYDSPAQHPRIAVEEKDYIEKALGDVISKKKVIYSSSIPNYMHRLICVRVCVFFFRISESVYDDRACRLSWALLSHRNSLLWLFCITAICGASISW